MSRINHPISIGTDNPEYYTELLNLTSCQSCDTNQHPLSNQSSLDVYGIHHDLVTKRLQTLLNAVANISLSQKGNISATMARLRHDNGAIDIKLYIAFNKVGNESAYLCEKHLETIFQMLCKVPYASPPIDGSPSVTQTKMKHDYIEICQAIHNYSFNMFEYRINKHKGMVSKFQKYIEQDQETFFPGQRQKLMDFLHHMSMIITVVAEAYDTRQLPLKAIQMLTAIYSYWKKHNILPEDDSINNSCSLLYLVDMCLADVPTAPSGV